MSLCFVKTELLSEEIGYLVEEIQSVGCTWLPLTTSNKMREEKIKLKTEFIIKREGELKRFGKFSTCPCK